MTRVREYQRRHDGTVVQALQYGNPDGTWDGNCISRIAAFLLNMNVNSGVTIANERILDIVRPLLSQWGPHAPIEVADPGTGHIFTMKLGDWAVKSGSSFVYVQAEWFEREYQLLPSVAPVRTEHDELSELIYKNLSWEGEIYQVAAERVATLILEAGWSRK